MGPDRSLVIIVPFSSFFFGPIFFFIFLISLTYLGSFFHFSFYLIFLIVFFYYGTVNTIFPARQRWTRSIQSDNAKLRPAYFLPRWSPLGNWSSLQLRLANRSNTTTTLSRHNTKRKKKKKRRDEDPRKAGRLKNIECWPLAHRLYAPRGPIATVM